ncbi:MAG TPA: prepilin peptidase [Hyphomonadaceae bacterium]|nr:prepilin peptidase [Hyphomonadaceae bacterium]
MASVIWIVFAGLFLASAVADASSYRIPNWISVTLALLFVIATLASGQPVLGFWPHLVLAVGVLLVGYLLYLFTGMGAGDAKLAAVAALWAGLPGLYAWTFFLALAMAVLALGLVAARRIAGAVGRSESTLPLLQRGAPVPLGVAIAAAAILASGRFDPALWPI